jgi:Domain of unknown function (DUF1990)
LPERCSMRGVGAALAAGRPGRGGDGGGVLARHHGFWPLNLGRVVHGIEDSGVVRGRGFAYGRLPEHGESG